MARQPVIIDTDGGVVSCDALWWALTSPDVEVVAVTSERGVVDPQAGAENLERVLEAAGRTDVPIAVGRSEPLGPVPDLPSPAPVHGNDGLGDSGYASPYRLPAGDAVALLARAIEQHQGNVTLLGLGPFTNIGALASERPELVPDVGALVVMGGVARPPGNATPVAEMNMACDPTAAALMVAAPWSTPPTMVGLDVTHRATLAKAEFDALEARRTPQAEFMAAPFTFFRNLGSAQISDGTCPSHDTLAAMAAIHPEIVQWRELPVAVDDAGGPAWGMTVVDFRALDVDLDSLEPDLRELAEQALFEGKARWRIALEVDTDEFRRRVRDFYLGSS